MFLSIIIPIWNDERYLEECLDSCLDQKLSKDEYEIICVDDGSDDSTPKILNSYNERFPNIRVFLRERHQGGRMFGYSQARGEYVWFVDHDDIVAPNAIDDLYQAVREHPGTEQVCFYAYQFYHALTDTEQKALRDKTMCPNFDKRLPSFSIWASIFRKSFLLSHDILPRSRHYSEASKFWEVSPFFVYGGDTTFTDEVASCVNHILPIAGRPLYLYRRTDESQTMNLSADSRNKRNYFQFCRALFEAYLADQLRQSLEHITSSDLKEKYTAQRIVKIRQAVTHLATLPGHQWKDGMHRLKEKNIFLPQKPTEYNCTLRSYLKLMPRKSRYFPSTIIQYYSFTSVGAVLYRISTWFSRTAKQSRSLVLIMRKARAANLQRFSRHNLSHKPD